MQSNQKAVAVCGRKVVVLGPRAAYRAPGSLGGGSVAGRRHGRARLAKWRSFVYGWAVIVACCGNGARADGRQALSQDLRHRSCAAQARCEGVWASGQIRHRGAN